MTATRFTPQVNCTDHVQDVREKTRSQINGLSFEKQSTTNSGSL